MIVRPLLLVGALVAIPAAAAASSDAAWTAFRTDVAAKCNAQAKAEGMKAPQIFVHPWGTSAHGVAVLVEGADKRICVYDKQKKTVELTPAP